MSKEKKETALVVISEAGLKVARTIQKELPDAIIYYKGEAEGTYFISSYQTFVEEHFGECSALIFVGALGICVRCIAAQVAHKYHDPAVVNVDSTGKFVIPVLSGHVGGGNELARHLAGITGGEAIITTQSDNQNLWALDLLARQWGWHTTASPQEINQAIFAFVGGKKTALLLEVRTSGAEHLEASRPPHVDIFYRYEDIPLAEYSLLISVGYSIYAPQDILHLAYYTPLLMLGVGCKRDCPTLGVSDTIEQTLTKARISPLAIGEIATIELKKDEPLIAHLAQHFSCPSPQIYTASQLGEIEVPHPSQKVYETTGAWGVAEASALASSQMGRLLIEKTKGSTQNENDFTFAVALPLACDRSQGHIEIVGAGPGDPELISVRGKKMLQRADLILYAGSLVPRELTLYGKEGAVIRSSANMNLEEQFSLMKEFYDKGLFVVRLHTGDPCIYGAIAEQMAFFDRYNMSYHITPGISSFQAAAAALRSQFTIPEEVQTIILTRGEGRTPMPEREQLHLLARSQSTMCIYLSAAIVERVQAELLQVYPPNTPVAACYKLTHKEERIYRGELSQLAQLVRENNLTLTTLLVVGKAIDHREGVSRLYADEFKHLFRK